MTLLAWVEVRLRSCLWSCLIVWIAVFGATTARAEVVRAPYLQSATPTSIVIMWRSDSLELTDSRVWLGADPAALTEVFDGDATIPSSNRAVVDHTVMPTGLAPNTRYYYAVGTATGGVEAGATEQHYFVTPPSIGAGEPVSIWVVGDSGDNSTRQLAVRDAMLALVPTGPDLFLHVGDIAYNTGTDAEFTTNHFAVYSDILIHAPFWPAIGNHEASSGNSSSGAQSGPYYEAFSLPTRGQAGGKPSGTEAYYAFDYGDVHFVVLDSDDTSVLPGSPQIRWLERDLSGLSTSQRWLVALFHHPPYSKGSHDSDSFADSGGRLVAMRENVLPILEAAGVDLVLAGHSHIYERSYLVDQAYGYGECPSFETPEFTTLEADGRILDSGDGAAVGDGVYQKAEGLESHAGTVYVVAGHGGRGIGGTGNHPIMYFSELANGSCLLTIDNDTLVLQNIRSDGIISDEFAIVKSRAACLDAIDCDDGLLCTNDDCVASACQNVAVVCPDGEECSADTGACGLPTELVSFRQGVEGYEECVDTVLRESTPMSGPEPATGLTWDAADPNGSGQSSFSVIRFGKLFESQAGPIPNGASIRSARLSYTVFNAGNAGEVYEVAHPWNVDATFDAFGSDAGIEAEDLGVRVGSAPGSLGLNEIDVTSSVAAWAGTPDLNHGWIVVPTGPNGVSSYASEATAPGLRPKLDVEYLLERCTSNAECDDLDACTLDSCDEGVCRHFERSCDDENACTVDSCDPEAGCGHASRNCDDRNACTQDSCTPVGIRCALQVLGCDAGDTCSEVGCSSEAVQCGDDNVCTDDDCDPDLGCIYSQNTVVCDDGDTCTIDDRCASGACRGRVGDCVAEASECQVAQCATADGSCLRVPVVDGTTCSTGVCVAGVCVSYDASGFEPPGDAGASDSDAGAGDDIGSPRGGSMGDSLADASQTFPPASELRVRGGCGCRVGARQSGAWTWCWLAGLLALRRRR